MHTMAALPTGLALGRRSADTDIHGQLVHQTRRLKAQHSQLVSCVGAQGCGKLPRDSPRQRLAGASCGELGVEQSIIGVTAMSRSDSPSVAPLFAAPPAAHISEPW